jgi:PST family polysaccharide transporter
MIWLAVAIALPMTFLSSLLVPFLFGEAYIDSIPVLIVHIWAVPLVFLLVVSGKWFIIENLSFMEFYRNLIAMIINIACNFALIPIYGQVGAALATLIAFLFSAYLFDVISSKTRVQFYLKSKAIIGKGLM